jgi:hypothetical protein
MLMLLAYVVLSYIVINEIIKWKKLTKTSDKVGAALIGTLASVMIYVFMCIAIMGSSSYKQEYVEYDKEEIVALENAMTIHGSFFLGTGYIGKVPHYVFYNKLPKGGKQLGTLKAESAVVYEEDRTDGYKAKQKERKVFSALKPWAWLLIPEFMLTEDRCSSIEYALHVPKGTIKTGFNLDLKDLK